MTLFQDVRGLDAQTSPRAHEHTIKAVQDGTEYEKNPTTMEVSYPEEGVVQYFLRPRKKEEVLVKMGIRLDAQIGGLTPDDDLLVTAGKALGLPQITLDEKHEGGTGYIEGPNSIPLGWGTDSYGRAFLRLYDMEVTIKHDHVDRPEVKRGPVGFFRRYSQDDGYYPIVPMSHGAAYELSGDTKLSVVLAALNAHATNECQVVYADGTTISFRPLGREESSVVCDLCGQPIEAPKEGEPCENCGCIQEYS